MGASCWPAPATYCTPALQQTARARCQQADGPRRTLVTDHRPLGHASELWKAAVTHQQQATGSQHVPERGGRPPAPACDRCLATGANQRQVAGHWRAPPKHNLPPAPSSNRWQTAGPRHCQATVWQLMLATGSRQMAHPDDSQQASGVCRDRRQAASPHR